MGPPRKGDLIGSDQFPSDVLGRAACRRSMIVGEGGEIHQILAVIAKGSAGPTREREVLQVVRDQLSDGHHLPNHAPNGRRAQDAG